MADENVKNLYVKTEDGTKIFVNADSVGALAKPTGVGYVHINEQGQVTTEDISAELNPATSVELGGIKLFANDDTLPAGATAVKLDGNNKAYVEASGGSVKPAVWLEGTTINPETLSNGLILANNNSDNVVAIHSVSPSGVDDKINGGEAVVVVGSTYEYKAAAGPAGFIHIDAYGHIAVEDVNVKPTQWVGGDYSTGHWRDEYTEYGLILGYSNAYGVSAVHTASSNGIDSVTSGLGIKNSAIPVIDNYGNYKQGDGTAGFIHIDKHGKITVQDGGGSGSIEPATTDKLGGMKLFEDGYENFEDCYEVNFNANGNDVTVIVNAPWETNASSDGSLYWVKKPIILQCTGGSSLFDVNLYQTYESSIDKNIWKLVWKTERYSVYNYVAFIEKPEEHKTSFGTSSIDGFSYVKLFGEKAFVSIEPTVSLYGDIARSDLNNGFLLGYRYGKQCKVDYLTTEGVDKGLGSVGSVAILAPEDLGRYDQGQASSGYVHIDNYGRVSVSEIDTEIKPASASKFGGIKLFPYDKTETGYLLECIDSSNTTRAAVFVKEPKDSTEMSSCGNIAIWNEKPTVVMSYPDNYKIEFEDASPSGYYVVLKDPISGKKLHAIWKNDQKNITSKGLWTRNTEDGGYLIVAETPTNGTVLTDMLERENASYWTEAPSYVFHSQDPMNTAKIELQNRKLEDQTSVNVLYYSCMNVHAQYSVLFDVDPTISIAGEFGGNSVALQLDKNGRAFVDVEATGGGVKPTKFIDGGYWDSSWDKYGTIIGYSDGTGAGAVHTLSKYGVDGYNNFGHHNLKDQAVLLVDGYGNYKYGSGTDGFVHVDKYGNIAIQDGGGSGGSIEPATTDKLGGMKLFDTSKPTHVTATVLTEYYDSNRIQLWFDRPWRAEYFDEKEGTGYEGPCRWEMNNKPVLYKAAFTGAVTDARIVEWVDTEYDKDNKHYWVIQADGYDHCGGYVKYYNWPYTQEIAMDPGYPAGAIKLNEQGRAYADLHQADCWGLGGVKLMPNSYDNIKCYRIVFDGGASEIYVDKPWEPQGWDYEGVEGAMYWREEPVVLSYNLYGSCYDFGIHSWVVQDETHSGNYYTINIHGDIDGHTYVMYQDEASNNVTYWGGNISGQLPLKINSFGDAYTELGLIGTIGTPLTKKDIQSR